MSEPTSPPVAAATAPTQRPSLLAWRNAVFAVFFLSGLSVASWVARIPAVRDDLQISLETVGLVILGMSIGAVVGLSLSAAILAIAAAGPVTPYGTETMHVLRAEKGYFIVGQETDGTVDPYDLGASWMVGDAAFVGRRSHRRAESQR